MKLTLFGKMSASRIGCGSVVGWLVGGWGGGVGVISVSTLGVFSICRRARPCAVRENLTHIFSHWLRYNAQP